MANSQDRPDASDAKKAAAGTDSIQRAIHSLQIHIPSTLIETMRAYDRLGAGIAKQVGADHIARLTAGLNSGVIAAMQSLQAPSIGSVAAQVLQRHERSVLAAFGSVQALAVQRTSVLGQVLKVHDAQGRALADVMRQADYVNKAHSKAMAALASPINISLSIDKLLQEAIQAANVQVPAEPLAEEALAETLFADDTPEVTLNAEVVDLGGTTTEGQIVIAVSLPWFRIYEELQKNPDFLFQFVDNSRRFEEFIAGAYELAGWKVTLTPRSGDFGRDVIAEKSGFGSLRFLEQCKAYSPGHRVPANDVRVMFGVLSGDAKANKALVTTTSKFAPGIEKEPGISPFLGNRLELKDGPALLLWLKEIVQAVQD